MEVQNAYRKKMATQLKEWTAQINLLEARLDKLGGDMRVKGAGELHELRARQRAAAAIVATFDPIDHLAGLILAREAGAQVHDLSGPAPTFPTRGPLLVTAPWCARPMVEVFARYGVA